MTAMGLSTITFFLYKAETIQDRGITFYIANTDLIVAMSHLSLIYKMTNIFGLIETFDGFIEKSEFKNEQSKIDET